MGLSTDYAGVRLRGSRNRATRRHGARRAPSAAQTFIQTGLLIAMLGGGGLTLGGAVLDTVYAGRALPAVHFENLPLGGLHQDEVRSVLETHTHAFSAAPYVFFHGTREWRPTGNEAGLRLDLNAMAAAAVLEGRSAPWPLRYLTSVASLVTRPAVPLHASLDRGQLGAFLGAVAAEVDREPTNAGLSVRNGQLVVGQAAQGRRVDVAATVERVAVPNSPVQSRVEVLVGAAQPALPDSAIHEAQAMAAKILAAPLTLRLGERGWTLSPAQLGAMLEFRRVPAASGATGERLSAGLAEARVAAYVRTLAAEVDKPAIDAQLRWNNNAVTVTRESAEGFKLDQPAAVRSILAQAAGDARDVALTTSVTKPAVTSDPSLVAGIKQLVATGSSKFAGSSPERVNNIQVAASKLDGVVIPPGAAFSFLSALGPITKENGYQEGLTIQGDATVPGIGGGVCQVSTTVFRAAFFAGLPILERHQHTYRVGYYEQDGSPVGFDAAVYDPGVDLRFKNDTEHALLMHAQLDARTSTLTFRFYSTPAGRNVRLTPEKANEVKAGPRLPDMPDPTLPGGTRKQVEWSADGADATIRRLVTVGGQTLLSDAFFSRYVPWREKWVVGTG